MKRPRFSLRTLLFAIALLSVPLGWTAYHLNWIRQRHEFLNASDVMSQAPGFSSEPAVWPLPWFGETRPKALFVPFAKIERAQELFPEVPMMPIMTPMPER